MSELNIAVRVFVTASAIWAAGVLIAQVLAARGGGRRDFSQQVGSPLRGVLYAFTGAMLPWHKETIRAHPLQFVAGLVMHAGVILCLLIVLLVLANPQLGTRVWLACRPVLLAPLVAGVYLLVRRVGSPTLRLLSVPDDYVALVATLGLLSLGSGAGLYAAGQMVFLIYAGLLFIYLPLGKLRHAVFFFIARGDYGRRLGYRGVYPPTGGD